MNSISFNHDLPIYFYHHRPNLYLLHDNSTYKLNDKVLPLLLAKPNVKVCRNNLDSYKLVNILSLFKIRCIQQLFESVDTLYPWDWYEWLLIKETTIMSDYRIQNELMLMKAAYEYYKCNGMNFDQINYNDEPYNGFQVKDIPFILENCPRKKWLAIGYLGHWIIKNNIRPSFEIHNKPIVSAAITLLIEKRVLIIPERLLLLLHEMDHNELIKMKKVHKIRRKSISQFSSTDSSSTVPINEYSASEDQHGASEAARPANNVANDEDEDELVEDESDEHFIDDRTDTSQETELLEEGSVESDPLTDMEEIEDEMNVDEPGFQTIKRQLMSVSNRLNTVNKTSDFSDFDELIIALENNTQLLINRVTGNNKFEIGFYGQPLDRIRKIAYLLNNVKEDIDSRTDLNTIIKCVESLVDHSVQLFEMTREFAK